MVSTVVLSFLLAIFIHGVSSTNPSTTLDAVTAPHPTSTVSSAVGDNEFYTPETGMLNIFLYSSTAVHGRVSSEPSLTKPRRMSVISTALTVSEVMGTISESFSDVGSGASEFLVPTITIETSPTPSAVATNEPLTMTKLGVATSEQFIPSETKPPLTEPSGPTPTDNKALVAGIAVASVVLFVLIIILCALICFFHMHK